MDVIVLRRLAGLLRRLNCVLEQIATLTGRPGQLGHVGEFIASQIFDLALEDSAANKGFDGRFTSGGLAGKTVDVK